LAFETIREFIKLESSGGIILFATAVLALIISNTALHSDYVAFFNLPFTIHLGAVTLSKPLLLWINDGFMAVFFLLVGLEIKREMFEGELNSLSKAALPAMAAIGGMVVPALIYVYFNHGDAAALKGWAIPTATDIAFSLGIVALLGSRVPVSLKIFLTALAIFDDMGAIGIIAIFYTKEVSMQMLLLAAGLVIVLMLLNRFKVMRMTPYILVGIALWICVLKSGVHATLAGIVLAFAIPLRHKTKKEVSPVKNLEHQLHPWVAFGILPVFAFANAGVTFTGITKSHFISPIPLGIACGLFFGKQIGIWLASYLSIKSGFAQMPRSACFMGIYGVSLIAGVGFTMSLFIGTLAFGVEAGSYSVWVRLGVILGSLLSGLFGYFVLRYAYRSRPVEVA
jgi:Na+:H+ antiporter, NhaA family